MPGLPTVAAVAAALPKPRSQQRQTGRMCCLQIAPVAHTTGPASVVCCDHNTTTLLLLLLPITAPRLSLLFLVMPLFHAVPGLHQQQRYCALHMQTLSSVFTTQKKAQTAAWEACRPTTQRAQCPTLDMVGRVKVNPQIRGDGHQPAECTLNVGRGANVGGI